VITLLGLKDGTLSITSSPVSLIFVLGCLVSSATAGNLRTVVLSAVPAPGIPTGGVFSSFGVPSLNNAGQTAFKAGLTGTGISLTNNIGIWSDGAGNGLALIARTRSAAPDTSGGTTFSSLREPVLNSEGQTTFVAFLAGSEVDSMNNNGIWSEKAGSGLSLYFREGDEAPGTLSGTNFSGFASPVLSNTDKIVFKADLTGTGVDITNDIGIWADRGNGVLSLVARYGSPAPDTQAGVNFSNFVGSSVLNGLGQTAFWGFLTGTGIEDANNSGIWSEGGGNGLALVAREGDTAPGTSAGTNFTFFSKPVINGQGHTAFWGSLLVDTGAATVSNNTGIWSEGSGNGLALVAREGFTAPDVGLGRFSILNDPVLNGAGQVAFIATLFGTGVHASNNSGIWSEGGDGVLSLVAREGSAAPGTPAGVTFLDFFGTPSLNGAGQTAFGGSLSNGSYGLWAEDISGDLRLIVRTGETLDVDDGPGIELRTVLTLSFFFQANSGNEDGRQSGFNDLGQVAFNATFTDGSHGIFVSNLVAIPEPSTLFLAALSTVGIFLKRRR